MRNAPCIALVAVAFAAAATAHAQPAAAPAAAVSTPAPSEADALVDTQRGGEPAVQRNVIEDGRARIEELRVRGQLQKVTVDPKGRLPSYEIVVGDGSRDLSEGAGASRGAIGKRVWNILKF